MAKWSALLLVCLFVAAMTECRAFSFSNLQNLALDALVEKYGSPILSANIPGAEGITIAYVVYLLSTSPKILPLPLHLEYRDPSQLKDGDVLVTSKTFAVVSSAEEKKAICFATPDQQPVSDLEALWRTLTFRADVHLKEVDLDEVLDTDHGFVEVAHQQNPEEILKRARDKLGEPFKLFSFNSEHFVTLAVTGKEQSPQLENLKSVAWKAGFTTFFGTPEGREVLRKFGKISASILQEVGEESMKSQLSKQVVDITVSNMILEEVAAKETVKKTTGKVASGAASASSKLISQAKTSALMGLAVEGVSLAYTLYDSHEKMKQGEISEMQFKQHTVKSIGAAAGSATGNTIGGIIGSAILPGWGTLVGGVVGGMVGNYLGSWNGEQVAKVAFDQN